MKVFITGGSGFVGGHLLRRLAVEAVEAVALARSEQAAERVEGLGARAWRADLSDLDAMEQGMGGCEVVFHCAAVIGTNVDRDLAEQVNVIGTGNVVEAARSAEARRLVHLSTESVLINGQPLEGVDESLPVPTEGHLSEYARTKAEAERIVLAANERGLETIALRPRLVWGPEDGTWLPGLIAKVESGFFRWVDGGRHLGSTCHVFNLVEAMMLAVDHGTPGSAYFITDGPPRPFKDFASGYLATAGIAVGEGSAPGWLMRSVGSVVESTWRLLPTDSAPPVNRVEAYMVSHPQVFDDSRARSELGYMPVITVDEGLARLVEADEPG